MTLQASFTIVLEHRHLRFWFWLMSYHIWIFNAWQCLIVISYFLYCIIYIQRRKAFAPGHPIALLKQTTRYSERSSFLLLQFFLYYLSLFLESLTISGQTPDCADVGKLAHILNVLWVDKYLHHQFCYMICYRQVSFPYSLLITRAAIMFAALVVT